MATKRTITDHKTGYKSEFITEDDKLVYHTTQDVAPVIDHVKKLRDNTLKPGKDMRHIAEVPYGDLAKGITRRLVKRFS